MRATVALLVLLFGSCQTPAPPSRPVPVPGPTPAPAPQSAGGGGAIAITGVNLIPMTREVGVVPAQTVIVRNGRIEAIGRAGAVSIPSGTTRIDGRGKYLIPGLADMHVHLEYFETPGMLELFTRNGVTFVRSMDGRPRILEWKKAIAAGTLAGPSMITAGPLLDGAPPVLPDNTVVRTAAEAQRIVAEQQADGYDFIKVYTNLTTRAYEAILEEAKKKGMPVAGHVPRHSSMVKALQHHASIEHLADFDELIEAESSPVRGRFDWSKLYLAMEADPKKMTAAAKRVASAKVAIVPTLVQAEHSLATPSTLASWMRRGELSLVPAEVRSYWESRVRTQSERLDADDWVTAERGEANRLRLVSALNEAGATILAGTDTPNPFVVPGVSIHRELALLVQAGLTPKAALAAATREAALFTGQGGEWGTIEKGKRADLLLLRSNPLAGIGATADLDLVIVRGRVVRP